MKFLKNIKLLCRDINSGDFDDNSSVNSIIENVTKNLKNGSIIVLHENKRFSNKTLNALPEIINKIKKSGFEFCPIPYFS